MLKEMNRRIIGHDRYSRSQVLSTGWWSEDALDNTGEVVVATGLTEQSPIFSELAEGRIYRNPPMMNGEQIRSPLNCKHL